VIVVSHFPMYPTSTDISGLHSPPLPAGRDEAPN
jgi:hypothetical protein